MPNNIAEEKINCQRRLGAEVLLQPLVPFSDPENYARKAEIVAKERGGALFTNQFENDANFRAHFNGTGPEIWTQTMGAVDGFICSAGTGGTIAGNLPWLHQPIHILRFYDQSPILSFVNCFFFHFFKCLRHQRFFEVPESKD